MKTEHERHGRAQENTKLMQLNKGEKWLVNEEVKPFLQASENLLNDYISSGDHDYQALAEAIKAENDQLIRSCNMADEGHEQLHLWLYPHLVLIKSMQATENPVEAQKIIAQLQASYELYHQYFQ